MPDFNPLDPTQDSTTTLDYAGMPQQAPPEMVPGVPAPPQPSFQDQFEQKILAQLGMTKEDFIKKKLEEDRKTKKQKFFTGLGDVLGTLGSSRDRPFTTSLEKAKQEGGAEYDKLQPQLRQEAATIYAGKKQDSINSSKEAIEASKAASAEKERQNKGELQRLRLASDQGVRGAKEALLKKQAELVAEETSNYTKKFDTNEMRNFMAAQSYKEKYGDKYGEALENAAGLTDASKPASAMGMVRSNSPDQWKQSISRINQLDDSQKRRKLAQGGGTGTWRLVNGLDESDPNKLSEGSVMFNGKTGAFAKPGTGEPMKPMRPLDRRVLDTDEAAAIGEIQGHDALNSIFNLVSSGKDSKVLGAEGGNVISQFLRKLDGTTLSSESFRGISLKNMLLSHAKTMVGGRFPIALADALEKVGGHSWEDPKSQMQAAATILYSIQVMRAENRPGGLPANISSDPRFSKALTDEIDKFVKTATDNRKLSKAHLPIKNASLPSVKDIVQRLSLEGTKDPNEAAFDQKYGTGAR